MKALNSYTSRELFGHLRKAGLTTAEAHFLNEIEARFNNMEDRFRDALDAERINVQAFVDHQVETYFNQRED